MLDIVVDGKREIGRTSPFIFGQNLEHFRNIIYGGIFDEDSRLSDKRGFRLDVMEALRKIRPGILRWPGGCFAGRYHWENGVGPKSERPIIYDYAWGAEENNRFGTDEFIEYCRAVGAEPYITVNATSGTSEEAARWVEYCNLTGNTYYAQSRKNNGYLKPHNVKYWSIGNENWGDSSYAKKCRETARLMKRVDPNIKLTAVGEYLGSPPPSGTDWNLEVLKTAGDYIDFLSVHRYYYDRKEVEEKDYYDLLACPTFSERKLIMVAKLIDATKGFLRKEKDIKISMDEWNFRTNPLCSALATCRFFNTLHRLSNYVAIAGFFPAFIAGPFVITGKLIESLEDAILLESSYYAFDLYANHSGEIVLDTIVESETYDAELRPGILQDREPSVKVREVPYVDSSATLSADRRTLFVSAVNVHKDNNMAATIHLKNLSAKKVGRVSELNGSDVMAVNSADNRMRVRIAEKTLENTGESFTYEFPPHSTTIFELQVG